MKHVKHFICDAFESFSAKTAVITTQWTTNAASSFSTDSLNRGVEVSAPPKDAALMTASENNAEIFQEAFLVYTSSKRNATENCGHFLLNEIEIK